MKKLIFIVCTFFTMLNANEVNIKFASLVDHKVHYDNLDWVEEWDNQAKGIEYLYDIDNDNHGVGITYLNFTNSYGVKTIAKGFVYRHRNILTDDIAIHSKVYYLYQKGYYEWQVMKNFDNASNNEFWTPMVSIGMNYKGFTVDGIVLKDTLSAVVFGYAFRF